MRPFGVDPRALASTLVNRALEHEAWAQACLAAHAGSTFEIAVGPLATRMRIDAGGRVDAAPSTGTPPDLKLTLSPLTLPSFLANPGRWDEFVAADGDPALTLTLKGLAETLPWFVERLFAGAMGPIVGQRVADAGRRLLAIPEYAGARLSESVASYVRDESGLVTGGSLSRSFAEEVAAVALRVDAAAARIDALAARLTPAAPAKGPA
jgi:ubiquinone biosynthesis accessory factor UbiJ